MHHFAGANTRTMRARRTQPVQRYDFDVSDSEEEDDDREALPPQRGGSASRLRSVGGAAANEALAAPRDAASVVSDIKQAVSLSLRQSSAREMELMDEPYGQLLDNLLGLGESLQMAGAPHDAVVGAAEKLLRVQRGTLRRSTALLREARDYDPSRFVDGGGGNGNGEEDGGPAARGATAAAAGGGGAGSATGFAAKLARRRRSSSRRSGGGESGGESSGGESENGDGSDGAAADALAVELDPRARDALAELRQQEDRLDELRGYAPGERRRRRARGGDGDDGEVMEVRGGDGGGRPGPLATAVAGDGGGRAAAAGGVGGHHHHQNANALLGGARNARCPLTSKPLAEIADPVEDARGFVYERAAVERYILTETAKRFFGGGGRGTRAMPALPPPGSAASAYPADVVQRATDAGVVAPVAGTGHNVSLGALRPARRLLRELAARRARAAGGADEMEGGAGAGADADIEISG